MQFYGEEYLDPNGDGLIHFSAIVGKYCEVDTIILQKMVQIANTEPGLNYGVRRGKPYAVTDAVSIGQKVLRMIQQVYIQEGYCGYRKLNKVDNPIAALGLPNQYLPFMVRSLNSSDYYSPTVKDIVAECYKGGLVFQNVRLFGDTALPISTYPTSAHLSGYAACVNVTREQALPSQGYPVSDSYDINSSYPAIMASEVLPVQYMGFEWAVTGYRPEWLSLHDDHHAPFCDYSPIWAEERGVGKSDILLVSMDLSDCLLPGLTINALGATVCPLSAPFLWMENPIFGDSKILFCDGILN